MELLRARPFPETTSAAVVNPIGEEAVPDGLKIAAALRSAGIRIGLESGKRKLRKALAAAATRGVRFVILVGDEEAMAGKIRLKNMLTGAEELMTAQEAIARIARQQGEA